MNNERNCSIDVESHSVTLSQIFSWWVGVRSIVCRFNFLIVCRYHVDFGADDDEMLTTLLQWLSPSRRHLLRVKKTIHMYLLTELPFLFVQMMLHNHRQKVTVRYFPYDWSLNDWEVGRLISGNVGKKSSVNVIFFAVLVYDGCSLFDRVCSEKSIYSWYLQGIKRCVLIHVLWVCSRLLLYCDCAAMVALCRVPWWL